MEEVFPIAFGTLMVMVLVWFFLLKVIFKKLEREHPEKYKQMGEPGLIWNNSMKTGFATLKFIGLREHTDLNNPALSKLSDFALVFFVVYTLIFFSMSFAILNIPMQAAAI
jgi:hypothetical protein